MNLNENHNVIAHNRPEATEGSNAHGVLIRVTYYDNPFEGPPYHVFIHNVNGQEYDHHSFHCKKDAMGFYHAINAPNYFSKKQKITQLRPVG